MSNLPHLALTTGEPAGIGPDLCVLLSSRTLPCRLTLLADPRVIRERARQLGVSVTLVEGEAQSAHQPERLNILPHPLTSPVVPGRLDPGNASHVLALIETAARGCLERRFDAMVTAPVHKGVINDAGLPFTGHTEYIAALTGGHPVMMLATRIPAAPASSNTRQLRIALATTHLPLRAVADHITQKRLESVLKNLHRDLRNRFGLPRPKITVLGLNPHAGEGGHLGHEERQTIEPVLARLQSQGMDLLGPLPADTAFLPHYLERSDAFLAMYHDQGLPVLKYAGFGRAVNITLGLPIIRTSVDHGTALELAGSGQIDGGSLLEAIDVACHLARRSQA